MKDSSIFSTNIDDTLFEYVFTEFFKWLNLGIIPTLDQIPIDNPE